MSYSFIKISEKNKIKVEARIPIIKKRHHDFVNLFMAIIIIKYSTHTNKSKGSPSKRAKTAPAKGKFIKIMTKLEPNKAKANKATINAFKKLSEYDEERDFFHISVSLS